MHVKKTFQQIRPADSIRPVEMILFLKRCLEWLFFFLGRENMHIKASAKFWQLIGKFF